MSRFASLLHLDTTALAPLAVAAVCAVSVTACTVMIVFDTQAAIDKRREAVLAASHASSCVERVARPMPCR